MSDMPANLPPAYVEVGRVRVPTNVVRLQYSRASGPGGQNVNKVSSRCELWVKITDIEGLAPGAQERLRGFSGGKLTQADEIHIACDESRSQEGNRSLAIDRLRELIVKAIIEPKKRRKTKPSYGSTQRRLQSKKHRADIKRGRQEHE
jgi:ribosome-associated protein